MKNKKRVNRCFPVAMMLVGLFVGMTTAVSAQNNAPSLPPGIASLGSPTTNILVRGMDNAEAAARHADYIVRLDRGNELRRQGEHFFNQGKLAEAENLIKEADALTPEDQPDTWYLPKIYEKQERWSDMIALFRVYERNFPVTSNFALFPYALATVKVGKIEDAVNLYNRCLAVLPKPDEWTPFQPTLRFDGSPALVNRAHLEAAIQTAYGIYLYRKPVKEPAVGHFREALVVYPHLNIPQYYLGMVLLDSPNKAEKEEALRLLSQAGRSGSGLMRAAVRKLRETGYAIPQ